MKKGRNTATAAVYIVLEQDGKYLLGRRFNTGYQDGNYQVPAGHVEAGELPTEAIIREAKEEIGIEITPQQLEFVHMSYRPKHDQTSDRIDIFFRAQSWQGKVHNNEPDKCDDLQWISINQLPKNMVPHVRDALECIATGVPFRELNIDWLKKEGVYLL